MVLGQSGRVAQLLEMHENRFEKFLPWAGNVREFQQGGSEGVSEGELGIAFLLWNYHGRGLDKWQWVRKSMFVTFLLWNYHGRGLYKCHWVFLYFLVWCY